MSPKTTLQRFCDSFVARDAAAVAELFDRTGLFEFPFAAQRLVGRIEIENGIRRMCENLESLAFEISKTRENDGLIIAEGMMKAARSPSKDREIYPLSIIVEQGSEGAARISAYFDTFRQRPWLDGPVFPAG